MGEELFYLVSDLHIDDSVGLVVEEAMSDIFSDMVSNSITTLVISGDIFNFRKAQTLSTLYVFTNILESASRLGIEVIGLSGNHDKMNYNSEDSYLDLFKYNRNFRVVRDTEMIPFGDLDVWMIPFFNEKETFPKYLDKVEFNKGRIPLLITHIAVNGVRNNDGTEVEDSLPTSKLKQFKHVYVGHYHDRQIIDNTVYVGSVMQRNFGEDQFKGYTKIMSSGEYEFIDKEYLVYETVKLQFSDTIKEDLEKLSDMSLDERMKVRVVLNGTTEEIDSIRSLPIISSLKGNGIILKNDYISVDVVELDVAEQFTPFTKQNIFSEWDEFSEMNKVSKEEGRLILNSLL